MKHHRFGFALPRRSFLRLVPLAVAAPLLTHLPAAPAINPVPRTRRSIDSNLVWIADDAPFAVLLTHSLLNDAGYRHRTFTDRADTMEALWTTRVLPALVISDCAGHRMDIDTFMLLCREEDPRMKILLNTVYPKECLRWYTNKPNAFVQRFSGPDVFMREVNRLMGRVPRRNLHQRRV